MSFQNDSYNDLLNELNSLGEKVSVVAVSKTKPASDIMDAYNAGHRDFGENYVQELVNKQAELPEDIRWHFIGHLQRNKVKLIAPFVHLIHGVDSVRLLNEVGKQGIRAGRIINCLLQVHIASEETKFGFSEEELIALADELSGDQGQGWNVVGLMGMASFTDDKERIRKEFRDLHELYQELGSRCAANESINMEILSMGMSGDYRMAIEQGSNMIRIGSLIFGDR